MVLILASIVFSVIGTWISLSRLSPLTGLALAPGIGQVNVTVNSTLSFTLAPETVNFSQMAPGAQNDTTDNAPPPFNLTNDGSVLINVSLKENIALFSTAAQNTTSFQAACGNQTIDGNCSALACRTPNDRGAYCFPPNWQNVSTTAQNLIAFQDFSDTNDTVLVHLNVTVPSAEPGGQKLVNLTFSASQAS